VEQEEKNKNLFLADFFFSGKFLGGGKICPSILNWYQKSKKSKIPMSPNGFSIKEVFAKQKFG